MKTKNLILTTAFLIVSLVAFGQVEIDPTTVPSLAVHPDTTTTGYGTTSLPTSIDSLTIGATNVKYMVAPDPSVTEVSSFSWGITNSNTITADVDSANLAKASFSNLGAGLIWVKETSTCTGDRTRIDYLVINKPVVTSGAAGTVNCPSNAAPYNMNVPSISLAGVSSSVVQAKRIKITITITGPTDNSGTSGTIGTANTILDLPENSATPTLDLSGFNGLIDYPGTYTLDISNITDRISRKSVVSNDPNVSVTFTVNRRPVTGKVYHVPNI